MKKTPLFSVCAALTASLVSCGGPGGKAKTAETADAKTAKKAVPEYTVVDNAQVDLASFPQDKDGYYVIFDGKTLNGWRGYGKDKAPSRWTVEDGAIKFNGSGGGEAQTGEGGDLIFAKKFKNFELESRSTSRAPSIRCSTTPTIPMPSWVSTATASRRRSTT